MIEETRFKCLNLNVCSKMPLSQSVKLCDNTFLIFSHLITFELIIDLNNDLSFGKHANTKRGHVPCLLCKTFAAKCLLSPRLKYCIYNTLLIFELDDLDLDLNNNLSFGQPANTEEGHFSCLLCKTFAANAFFSKA